jgi:hypothetical protein
VDTTRRRKLTIKRRLGKQTGKWKNVQFCSWGRGEREREEEKLTHDLLCCQKEKGKRPAKCSFLKSPAHSSRREKGAWQQHACLDVSCDEEREKGLSL